MVRRNLMITIGVAACGGCASMPPLEMHYYHPKVVLQLTATQTATCTSENEPIVVTHVEPSRYYSADLDRGTGKLDLRRLGAGLSKADMEATFYPDGRLQSINSSATGQAEQLLKGLIEHAIARPFSPIRLEQERSACAELLKIAGEDKILTVVSTTTVSFGNEQIPGFKQESIPESTFNKMAPIFGKLTATLAEETRELHRHHLSDKYNGVTLELIAPKWRTVGVKGDVGDRNLEWRFGLAVPQNGDTYRLPIQKGVLFGKNTFQLALGDSGAITKLKYSGERGMDSAFGVLNDLRDSRSTPSVEEQAGKAKAQADLIFQQQRLLLCTTDPANCPK